MSLNKADWEKIEIEYITNPSTTYNGLAEKYGVSCHTLYKRAKKGQWAEKRRKSGENSVKKATGSFERRQEKRMNRVLDIADRLLDRLEEAVEELDVAQVRKVVKTKEIEYKNDKNPRAPTKEVITEKEQILEVESVVDRNGLRSIAAALLSIKDVQMLRTKGEKETEKIKLDILRAKKAELTDSSDNYEGETGVVLLPEVQALIPPPDSGTLVSAEVANG